MTSRPLLVFATASGRYAVGADRVRQIVWLPVLAETREAGAWVGTAHVRRDEIPVMDLDLAFGDEPEPYTLDHRLVDVETDGARIGIVAAEVTGVVNVDEDELLDRPEEAAVEAAVRIDGDFVEVLDPDRLAGAADRAEPGGPSPAELFDAFDEEEVEELASRQRQLVERPRRERPAEATVLVLTEIGASAVAIPVDEVREFVRVSRLTPVPSTPDHVLGLMNHRGEIVCVVDVAQPLGLGTSARRPPEMAAIVDTDEGWSGIAIDRVGDTLRIDRRTLDAEASPRPGVLGTIRHEGGPIPAVDPAGLLSSETIVVEQEA